MVQSFNSTTTYSAGWNTVTSAFWVRYPNPFATHVLAGDVIDQYVEKGRLYTTRLLLKRGTLPRWAKSFVPATEGWILEESVIDPKQKWMTTNLRNISYARIMLLVEKQTVTVHPQKKDETVVNLQAEVVSAMNPFLRGRIERYGIDRFAKNTVQRERGMQWILQSLLANDFVSCNTVVHEEK